MTFGIVLIHGYTGTPESLQPLSDQLSVLYGHDSVAKITLPGHSHGEIPEFNKDAFIYHILKVVRAFQKQGRKLIFIGHSTGGILALASIKEHMITPHLLILVGVPKKINTGSYDRWIKHRGGSEEVSFIDIAKMVSIINSIGKLQSIGNFPVLIMNGEIDELVPPEDAYAWKHTHLTGQERTVIIPRAGHDLLHGMNSVFAIDIILRAIYDINEYDKNVIDRLTSVEPEVEDFITTSPGSRRHLALCPSGQRLKNSHPVLKPFSDNEPVFANIEITTHCNLSCKYCARSHYKRKGQHMNYEVFRNILNLLPHVYRVTLVGLGEPTLHPNIIDFVSLASSMRRRVGLVTNAMSLNESLSRRLIEAGLKSIAFSIDAPNQDLLSNVRSGANLEEVINNISKFIIISQELPLISKAVFSAVSIETIPYLNSLIDLVSRFGVNVLMLTDLNYRQNLKNTLWKNTNDYMKKTLNEAVRHAFLRKLPVLSVHGLEEFGLVQRYRDFLLLPPDQLYGRSVGHKWCFSPWQTLPVDVEGNATICDCQPENNIGNILLQPFTEIWNGKEMVNYRERMLSPDPPESCRICPRF